MKLPANIDYWHTLETLPSLIGYLPADVQSKIGNISSYFVKQRRGRAYSKGGKPHHFTVPVWILSKPLDYQVWYVAHEVAHILDFMERGRNGGFHDKFFHKILFEICPRNSVHHEVSYMKRAESRINDFTMEDLI
jgi:hypothetical protein